MSDKSPSGSGARSPSPAGRRSAVRVDGVLISLVTAAIVFAGGNALVPKPRKHEPPAPVIVPAPAVVAPAPPAPPAAAADASADRHVGDAGDASIDAGASDGPASKAATHGDGGGDDERASASGDAASPGGDAGDEASPDCALAEKDIAREAWRRNWPTICPVADTGKAFILIPIKGSIESAIWELRRKPVREARVNLPNAESQLTLKLYKLRRLGFKDLKIGALDDGNGTRLRVRLMPDAGDPVFDVKDTYAKITVATPAEQ